MIKHRIRQGLDLPLAGLPEARVHPAPAVTQVALLGADAPGLRAAMAVQAGQHVRRGDCLYEDRRRPGVRWCAPAAGVVRALHRGARRMLMSVVIDVDGDDGPDAQAPIEPELLARAGRDAASVRSLLLVTGLWPALRTRPYSHAPAADAPVPPLFVTAIDTQPHAPDPVLALAGREDDFQAGLAALLRLAESSAAPVFLCVADGSPLAALAPAGVQVHGFSGPHPAGTAGLHIHRLHPVGAHRSAWHIGAQDVAAIGHLLRHGRLDVTRVVSIAGPGVARPRLLRTRLGAAVHQLLDGELLPGEQRVVCGSVLHGRAAGDGPEAFLGRFHHQVSVLPEGRTRDLFGWITPQADKFSLWNVVAGRLARQLPLTTTTNGSARAMVPIGAFERVMPMDIMPTHLLRALLTDDAEQAEALGVLELDEEDLALATVVCPGKTDYGPLLRRMLDRIEKEGV